MIRFFKRKHHLTNWYAFRELGMDLEQLDWLEQNAYPEEARFVDFDYSCRAYDLFVDALTKSGIMRPCILAD